MSKQHKLPRILAVVDFVILDEIFTAFQNPDIYK